MTPLMAIVHNHASPSEATPWVMQLLLNADADVNIAAQVSLGRIVIALPSGIKTNPVSQDGSTPLIIATSKGCSGELLTTLIKAGADVNRAKKVRTPSHVWQQDD